MPVTRERPLCLVDGEHPGVVMQWRQDRERGWVALVRYRAPHASGHLLTYEHELDAGRLSPRNDEEAPTR